MEPTKRVRVGRLSACIAGDRRYTDTITVWLNASGAVDIEVTETSAAGGMDGPGGATEPTPTFKANVGAAEGKPFADPRLVMVALKRALGNDRFSFRKYGKPTQRFTWTTGATGLSAAACKEALVAGRGWL